MPWANRAPFQRMLALGLESALPTFEITSSILTVDVGSCCRLTKPPNVGPTTASSPSQTAGPIPSGRRLPALAVAAITVGGALLLLAVICSLFACRRRAVKRGRKEKMHRDVKEYAVATARPGTPPSQPASPSLLSPLSTRALLDQRLCREELGLSSPPQPHQNWPQSPFNRRSVDTIFALRFYNSPEPEHHLQAPSIAELPATPRHRPVPAPPPTPPTSTTPPLQTQAFPRQKQIPQTATRLQSKGEPWASVLPPTMPPLHMKPYPGRRRAPQRTVYLNPAGEPWVNVPPPAVPLPAPPPPKRPPPRFPETQARPTFSLFPPPPNHHHHQPPIQSRPRPKLRVPAQNQNTSANNSPVNRNFSRPSPIAILPPTTVLTSTLGPNSAPLPVSSLHSGAGSGTRLSTNQIPPSTAAERRRTPAVTTHYPPLPGQEDCSAGGRKSLPSRLWDWRGGLGFGTWKWDMDFGEKVWVHVG
ncbi:hypothetical protein N657DRAFT_669665 [Parathielavia appendiculata]|uniref:Uncharacterized protein n=1 Tax=Parathielavia appendiculata TaxID=2587402 RepID=A0AAN6Z7Y3_9PEZI|nr:hypothetical protein N657DRAFT_669665 [Parathielavia appendiculata]